MKRFAVIICCAAAVLIAGGPFASAEPGCRLALHLKDGSTVMGVPVTNAIAVRTAYARMDIPLPLVHGFTYNDDQESVRIALRNGDRLNAVIANPGFVLSTLMGRISVGQELLKSVDVMRALKMPTALREGLRAHYSFDGNLDDACLPRRTAAATVESEYVRGRAGQARSFGKAGKVDVIRIPNVCTGTEHTVSFCVSVENPKRHNSIFQINRGANWPQADLWIFTSGGRLALVHAAMDMRNTGGRPDIRSDFNELAPIEANAAYHVVYTFRDGTARLYVSGKPYASYGGLPPLPVLAKKVAIGASRGPGRYHYQLSGWMDDLRIYARALSDAEIKDLSEVYR